ncbi:MAG: Mrp/NBP35 family ATP-binding protein [Bacteroidales bacterium]|nr:Mrp/NBP35 family ATP-binding protein [Bacteroidales bacterium]
MSYREENIFTALKHVIHPEKGKDIVSLKMVEDLEVKGKKISFTLHFDNPNDPFVSAIRKACVSAIQKYVDKKAEIKENISIKSDEVMKKDEKKVLPSVKNIIAIASGKGGVGKSTVATNLAIALSKSGAAVGLIDADIYGPSIPKMFNVEGQRPMVNKIDGVDIIEPIKNYGIKMLSIGFFINPDDALVWRGPMATNALKQLLLQSNWGELDYLLVDLPPGTSDVHLTLVQEVSVTGAIIVSTPQEVALADAIKGIAMFVGDKINVPVLGLVENMSWFTPEELPDNKYYIFGKDGCKKLAEKKNIPLLGQIPIVQSICEGGDAGKPSVLNEDSIVGKAFLEMADQVADQVAKRNATLDPTKKVEINPVLHKVTPKN